MKSLTIDAKSLTKKYGDQVAVASLDLQLKSGECFGLLGPNGAGKSSLLKMLCARTPMTSGEAYVLGFELKTHAREAKLRMGVMSQESGLEMNLTVLENLWLFATYFGMDRRAAQDRAEEVMSLVRIEKEKDRPVCELSGGWQKRVSLARALLNQPQVLILDEPTHSLDPIGKRRLWELLKQVRSDLGTILLCTHDILEAEALCDRVALMSRGRILVQGSPEELVKEKVGDTVIDFELKRSDFSYYLSRLKERNFSAFRVGSTLSVSVRSPHELQEVSQIITSDRMTVRKANLNDVFLRLTGQDLAVDEGEE